MAIRWKGLIAPTEVPTGDGRMFASGKMTHRPTPMPMMVRFGSGGHDGATVVGKVNRVFDGPGGYWGEGEFLDPAMVPEVPKAIYMLKEKVMGPSVDLDRDFTVEAVKHPSRPDKRAGLFKEYNVIGVTLVPMPAFYQVHMSIETDPEPTRHLELKVDSDADKTLLASLGIDAYDWPYFDVNAESWKEWPLAPRDYKYDADDAVKRIAYWAGIGSENPSIDRYSSAFLWRNGSQTGDSLAQDSFRLPLCDIINDEPHLIYHAVYSAAALLSGAHGGLPNIPHEDQQNMIPVINELYSVMAQAFGDSNLVSPFMEKVRQQQQASMSPEEDCGCEDMPTPNVTINIGDGVSQFPATTASTAGNVSMTVGAADEFAADKTPYGNVKYADPGYQDDGIKRYPLDSEEHCRAAWSYINMPKNAARYSPEELAKIKGRIQEALKKYGVQVSQEESSQGQMAAGVEDVDQDAVLASVAPLAPPTAWFENPRLKAPTRLTIDDDGHIFGHLAQWKVCHVGIGKSCVMAPKSRTHYGLFKVGTLRTEDGSSVDIGKITLGTGHADATWGVMPSREHYDNTGWAAAVVNIGEDQHGIWINGSLTTTMTPERVAELRASALSGDWRYVNGNLELVAALAVNNPGFPIYREQSGHAFSLMAVGVIGQEQEDDVSTEFSMENEDEFEDLEVDETAEGTDTELAARIERLAQIEQDLEEHNRERRMAQLAAIDQQREALADNGRPVPAGAVSPTSEDDAIFIQYNARYQALAEE
jgi:hypothetical protein